MMDGQADGVGLGPVRHRPVTLVPGGQLDGAVHEILQVARGEDGRIAGRGQLGGDLPPGLRVEADADRPGVLPHGPQEGRGDVQPGVGRVDLRIGAVAPVAEQRVAHRHRAVMAGHRPAIGIGSLDGQRLARAIDGRHRIDVLGELVQRIAAGRGAGHLEADGRAVEPSIGDADLRLVMLGAGKAMSYSTGACVACGAEAGLRRNRLYRRGGQRQRRRHRQKPHSIPLRACTVAT